MGIKIWSNYLHPNAIKSTVAKQRAISLGLQQIIEFKDGDVETVDLPASTFDAALCFVECNTWKKKIR